METPPTAGCHTESKRVKEQMILDTQAGEASEAERTGLFAGISKEKTSREREKKRK